MDSPPTAAKAGGAEVTKTVDLSALAYDNFLYAIKSETTKKRYIYGLNRYLRYLGYPNGGDNRIDVLLLSSNSQR